MPVPSTAAALRTALLALFILGSVGTTAELLLLGHTEDTWQLVPLVLMGSGLMLVGWYVLTRSATSLKSFRVLMLLFVVAGCIGILLHYRGNMEFELEMYPSMHGMELFRETMTGAFPALAPGAMIQFGLLGLAWTYRHPALGLPAATPPQET